MEEFSILLIKNNLHKAFRNDLIFQIASSSDLMSITNLGNARLNNSEKLYRCDGIEKDTDRMVSIRRKHDHKDLSARALRMENER